MRELTQNEIKETEIITKLLQKWVITREQAEKALSRFNLII